jgi:hypothetical protein
MNFNATTTDVNVVDKQKAPIMKKLTGTEGNNSIWRKQAAMGHP